MDLVSRLKQYLDYRQISVTQFADECAIPRPTGSQLLAGRNKKVSDEIISKIHAAYPELNIVWLMFGEGDMVKGANIEISEAQNMPKNDSSASQPTMEQTIDFGMDFNENSSENVSEKISTEPTANTFTFAAPSTPSAPFGQGTDPAASIDPTRHDISAPPSPIHIPASPQAAPLGATSPATASSSPTAASAQGAPSPSTVFKAPAPDFPGRPEMPQPSRPGSESFTVTPGKGKRVTGIVVYYDDCTYESFIPDPNHSHPFIR